MNAEEVKRLKEITGQYDNYNIERRDIEIALKQFENITKIQFDFITNEYAYATANSCMSAITCGNVRSFIRRNQDKLKDFIKTSLTDELVNLTSKMDELKI